MRLLKRRAGLWPEEVCKDSTDGGYGYESKLVAFRFREPLSREIKAELKAISAAVNQPAERHEVAEGLAAVGSIMPQQGDVTRLELWQESVWVAIEDFPADVINESLRNIIKREKWRPAPAEIREECFQVGRKRLALRNLQAPPTVQQYP